MQTIQCLGNSCRLCRNWSLCYISARFIQVCFSKFYLLCVKLKGHILIIHYSCINGWNVAQGTHSIPPIHSKMTGFLFWNILISKPLHLPNILADNKINEFSVVVVKGISLGTTFKITCWECYLINSVFIEIKSTWKVLESSLLLGG